MVRTRVRALWNDRQETRGERGVATRDMISWTHHVKHFELPLRMKSAIQVMTFMDCDFKDFMRDTVLAWFAETLTTSTDYQSADMLSPVSQRPTDCHTQHCAELLICYQECPERISRAFPGHYLCVCVCVCVRTVVLTSSSDALSDAGSGRGPTGADRVKAVFLIIFKDKRHHSFFQFL